MNKQKINHRYIGGFFEMALPDAMIGQSILSAWRIDKNPSSGFVNARSALFHLLKYLNGQRVLLPAYSCTSIMEACLGYEVAFYPLTESLNPDIHFLDTTARPGDVILAINYFGKAPSSLFLEFVKQRKDIIFIEDCAQSLSTGLLQWGDWRLFSPRKLLGVADGGFIVPRDSHTGNLTIHLHSDDSVKDRWSAAFLRFKDKEEKLNAVWHSLNQKHEQSMKVDHKAISYLSHYLLSMINIQPIIDKRKNNYKTLKSLLPSWAFLTDDEPSYAPFGFPMRVPQHHRDRLIQSLIQDNIFPAVHWRELAAPHEFKCEHQLSQELVTLPCDQRYGAEDMNYIAAAVHKFFAGVS